MLEELALMLMLAKSMICPSAEQVRELMEEPQTLAEITAIAEQALESESELGGEVCAEPSGMHFEQIRNRHVDNRFDFNTKSELKDIGPYIIADLNLRIRTNYIDDECAPYYAAEGWKTTVDDVLDKLSDAELVYYDEDLLLEAVIAYNDLVNGMYVKDKSGVCKDQIASFHTHDNGTSFSGTDLCYSRKNDNIEIVISVNREDSSSFDIYFVQAGDQRHVGTYYFPPKMMARSP